jgi:hypothetical protein
MTATTYMRRGRGKAKATLELIDACHEILAEIQPASVRAVCYRLFTMGLISDMSKGSTNKVSTQLVYAREQGVIPWTWVVDETREAERIALWTDPDAIIDAAVRGYRRDYWQDQPRRVQVWSEKGTVRGTLAPVLKEFGVTFKVMHGYGSATALWQAAEDSTASDKPLTVLYVGDFDPSGMHMSMVDLPGRIQRYRGQIDFRRVALVERDLPGLPSFDASTKLGDPRHRWFVERYGYRCWELDAMSPVLLRKRIHECVQELIEPEPWNHAIGIERAEVESMKEFAQTWQSTMTKEVRRG